MGEQPQLFDVTAQPNVLRVTLDYPHSRINLLWENGERKNRTLARVVVMAVQRELIWEVHQQGRQDEFRSFPTPASVRGALRRLRQRFPVDEDLIFFEERASLPGASKSEIAVIPFDPEPGRSPWRFLEEEIAAMGEALQPRSVALEKVIEQADPDSVRYFRNLARKQEKQERARIELEQRIRARRAEQAARARMERRRAALEAKSAPAPARPPAALPPMRPALPVPPVPLRVELPTFSGTLPLFHDADQLGDFLLVEKASLWWVSNQTDDLLCLPYCAIERLDFQIRTALRVIGPLQGRALLSDEVGLGKTIEAGLVLKEYLTRGMVKRFLVLTLPSLVDQWAEELESKFGLQTVTTNQPPFRANAARFWKENPAVIASLHTVKQDAHLAHAQQVNWDMLIVDEAHYLRSRDSKAWQSVNALPRQFLLLLTATPVQNSIEEIYNLVTLLKPGQLPSPQEFRARFVSKDRPHEPREPEELRRLLGAVMVRNTRSSAGIRLPPRRAETALFDPTDAERAFWEQWERDLRERLATLDASQASLWGRLLLQAAGSSPQAWIEAIRSFPDAACVERWLQSAPLQESWRKKLSLLPPLVANEGGLVVFSQFLRTQSALADGLREAGVKAWVINGQTPAAQRQPITDQFRAEGGVLLLTQSGTEGRNLQFCHRLVNFDLPWNPMVIEQRIGRLHRIGQTRAVEIFNLVQRGTLQQHLLDVLQEKLNLFELVVGETGLVLGDRFSSEDFEEEVFRRWRDSGGSVAAAIGSLGEELAAARGQFEEVKKLDETLFRHDYETA